jgi:hypothetical protein
MYAQLSGFLIVLQIKMIWLYAGGMVSKIGMAVLGYNRDPFTFN